MVTFASVLPDTLTSPSNEFRGQVAGINEPLSAGRGIVQILSGTPIPGSRWKLSIDLVAEKRHEGSAFIVIQHDLDEYGTGATEEQAVRDLLSSLLDYRLSLKKRANRLADRERAHLALLESQLSET